MIVFDFSLISELFTDLKICRTNIILGRDILDLGRITHFEALFSLKCPIRMSDFHVLWDRFLKK